MWRRLAGVEGRDAHQPMHAALAGQQAKGIFAGDGERGRLDARFFAVLVVVHFGLEALLLGPAQVHAHQHLGPVLALGAARARMHRDDGVQRVGLAGKHGAGFQILGERGQRLDFAVEIGEHVFAFAGQLEIGLDVAGAAHQLLVVGDQRFQPLAVAHQGLAGRGIGPQRRIGEFGFNFGEFPADAGRVKDTPAGRAPGRAREHRRIRDLVAMPWLLFMT